MKIIALQMKKMCKREREIERELNVILYFFQKNIIFSVWC